jgi:membrane-associated phospholipid phosphatase
MPLAGGPGGPPTLLESVVPLYHAPFQPLGVAIAEIVTLPGQVVVSSVLVAIASGALWRQGRRAAALAWPAVWLLASAVEVVFRHTLTRPALYRDGVHLTGLDASWPSGHALRCTIVACALGAAWPRLRVPLAIWLVAAVALLELAGFHTPTDVAGGLLLAAAAATGAVALGRSGQVRLWLLGRRGGLRRTGPAG